MNPLAIFAGPHALIAKWAVIGIALAAFGTWSWFKGNEHGTRKLTEYIGAQAKEATRIGAARNKVTREVVTRYIKVAGETQIVTQTVEKEVVRYAEANPGYCLDLGWRRLHDSAAANAVPDPRPGLDGAPRASEALTTVTANYAACHRTADRLVALQNWVTAQAGVK